MNILSRSLEPARVLRSIADEQHLQVLYRPARRAALEDRL
jgi:hypothetical protein